MASFPRATQNTVPAEGKDPMLVSVDYDKLGIGARSSGMPKGDAAPGGIMGLDHVGKSSGGKGKR